MKKVVIFQYRLLHYRVSLFEKLRDILWGRGVDLQLVCGQASPRELLKNDEGSLAWAIRTKNFFMELGKRDFVWQPFPSSLRNADLVIVMQESRIISNYPILLKRVFGKNRVAYWGHGRNFQSDAPSGMREYWKRFLLTRVDWWFAYTEMTVDILREAGYSDSRITCLDNAIDTGGFRLELAAVSDAAIESEKANLGIEAHARLGLFCGSLYPDKRLDLLILASDRIRQAIPGFELIVIGDGPSMPLMRQAALSRPWLHLLGVRKGREKAIAFKMAEVMLNPGLVGLHIVDAFCAGLVMVTTLNARHSPEVAYLRNGENGLAVDDAVGAYSEAVIDLLRDGDRRSRMSAAALRDSERYTLDHMVNNFANGIEAALRA